MGRGILYSGTALAAVLTMPALAHAQDQAADQAAPQGGLNEIVVTAQKQSESIQSVPISITDPAPIVDTT